MTAGFLFCPLVLSFQDEGTGPQSITLGAGEA